jgi:hypothetical protein
VASKPIQAQKFLKGKMAILDTELAHRGKRVLIVQGQQAPPKWMTQMGWDAFFHARENQDLKLAMTYIQHTSRPIRLVWAGAEPSPNIMAFLSRIEGLTLIGLGEKVSGHPDWQAIFWSSDIGLEEVEPVVQARMGSTGVTGLRSVLNELRGAQVGLVLSFLGDKRGELYWYDPAEGVEQGHIDLGEAAETLVELAAFLRK